MTNLTEHFKKHARPAVLTAALIASVSLVAFNADAADGAAIARGKYLVDIGGCDDCHTPMKMGANGPEPDMTKRLSGHPAAVQMPPAPPPSGPWLWQGAATNTAFAGPWGVSYAVNITPHRPTGLGAWTADNFVKALKTGKHLGVGRPIMPPMPWQAYSKMTERDLRAVFAYLQTVPAIDNLAPDYQPPKK